MRRYFFDVSLDKVAQEDQWHSEEYSNNEEAIKNRPVYADIVYYVDGDGNRVTVWEKAKQS